MSTRGRVRKMRGLEAVMASAVAAVAGTEPLRWVGLCEVCSAPGPSRRRWAGRTQHEAMARLCEHLRREHSRGMRALLRGFRRTP